jgi:hypothetical protein
MGLTAPRETIGTAQSQRHYGMDWLRIAAFALLIVYHVAMVFAPWAWVIKTPHNYPALIPPMALLTPWRLPLLFAVSGYASRKLFDRSGGALPFARSRASRLLVPLAFGMAAFVPIEMWVRVLETGYPHGYLHFWALDYWRIGDFYGREFPSWEHLWFVAYLASYSLLLAAVIGWRGAGLFGLLDRAANWLVRGPRLLWVPSGRGWSATGAATANISRSFCSASHSPAHRSCGRRSRGCGSPRSLWRQWPVR